MKLLGFFRDWRSGEWGLLFLLLISLCLKISGLFSDEAINLDGVRYINAAQQLAEGNIREALGIERMPFYSLLIAAFHFLVRDWVLTGQLISLFAMVLAVIPLYLLTKDVFDEKAAFWAGLAFALSPILNDHAVDLIRDPIFMFFVMWSSYFFYRAIKVHKVRFYFLACVSSVFALLCRIEGVFLFAVFLLVLLVLAIINKEERLFLLKGISVFVGLPLTLAVVLGGGLSLMAGVKLSSFNRFGELATCIKALMNGDAFDMYHRLYAQLKTFKNPVAFGTTGSFAETARHYIPVIYLLSVAEALTKNLFLINVIPLFAVFGKRPTFNRGHWLLLLLAGSYFLVAYYRLLTYDFISKRYVLVPALLLFPWVGLGLKRIWAGILSCHWPRMAMVAFLLVFCGVPAYKSLGDFMGPGSGNVIREAAEWLDNQSHLKSAVIACSDPRIRFYSSSEMTFLRQMDPFHVAKDFKKMERVAFVNRADVLIIEISQKKRRNLPEFKKFSLFKEFMGKKNDVLIYGRNN